MCSLLARRPPARNVRKTTRLPPSCRYDWRNCNSNHVNRRFAGTFCNRGGGRGVWEGVGKKRKSSWGQQGGSPSPFPHSGPLTRNFFGTVCANSTYKLLIIKSHAASRTQILQEPHRREFLQRTRTRRGILGYLLSLPFAPYLCSFFSTNNGNQRQIDML